MNKQTFFTKLLVLLGCFGGLWLGGQQIAQADDGAGFSIKAVQSKNQINQKVSYFDLKTKPATSQVLRLKVTNTDNQAKKLSVSPNDAFTNQNGVIEYSSRNVKKTGTAKYQFSDLVSEPQEVRLAGKQTKILKFKLKVPQKGFSGSILGGFYVKPVKNNSRATKRGMKINNEFAMLVGVHLHGKGTAVPTFKLNQVKATRQNDQGLLKVNLENMAPIVLSQLRLKARVTEKGQNKTVLKHTQKAAQMAPNSQFDWQVPVDKTLPAGAYTLHLTITRKGQQRHFTRDFKVKDTVTKFNAQMANRQTSNNVPWYYAVIGGALVIVIAILAFTLGRRRHS